jgi:glycine/D-amino acid oxidase-like deaminating enzyme
MREPQSFDLAVVGAGIVRLACALAAATLGKRVVVIDRDAQANGASVRNFGFITVTGQQRGRAAGCFTVGVSGSGNGVRSRAGADLVIETVADLIPALDGV